MIQTFRFGENEGANGRITTYNGSVALEPDYPDPRFCAVVTLGRRGGERARMILDPETARHLGLALIRWGYGLEPGEGIDIKPSAFDPAQNYVNPRPFPKRAAKH